MDYLKYNDEWFLMNGYWIENTEESFDGGEKYIYVITTEKFRKLIDTCIRKMVSQKECITPKLLVETIEGGNISRTIKKNHSVYIKKKRPEGYLTIKQRKEKAARIKAKKNVNRNSK